MSRKRLPQREMEICARIRSARLEIGKSQEFVAAKIGIERSTLTNYESGVTPVRYEVALRFCRHLIVSEEWLALGETPSLREAALKHGFRKDTDWVAMQDIFKRHAVDLLADAPSFNMKPSLLFSMAYDEHLAPRYRQLAEECFEEPRIVFYKHQEPDLAEELLACMSERWLKLLAIEAARHGQDPWILQRSFVYRVIRDSSRRLVKDYFGGAGAHYLLDAQFFDSQSVYDLTKTLGSAQDAAVRALWPELKKRLRKATAESGAKSKLAEFLKVDPTQVSLWLSESKSAREPSGEYALQMYQWVEHQERKK